MTDEFASYEKLNLLGYKHSTIKHTDWKYVDGDVHINTVENLWSQIKRSIDGTHHSAITRRYLPGYLQEFVWKYNNRHLTTGEMFFALLQNAPLSEEAR